MKASWHKSDLASVVSILESGSRPKGGASTETGEVASLGGENIVQSGGVTLADVKRVPQAFFKRMTKGHLVDGDVLINKDGAQTGKVGIYLGDGTGSACINEHVFLIRGNKEKICQDFLYYTLLSEHGQRQIAAQISGSAQPGLKSSFLKGVVTDIPDSLPEQTKIAEVLSTVDQAIEQTEALIAKQQRIKTGLMQDLLTRGIDEHGNLRSEQTHEFKDSPLGRIPVEWEMATLNSISEFVTSGARGWAQYYRVEGAVFLRIGNLTRSHINLRLDDTVYVQPPKSAEGQRTLVRGGDLLVSVTADLGIIGIIPESFGEAYVNQHIALVRLLSEKVNPRFVGWFLSGRGGQIQFENLNESGAKAGLNLPTLRSLMVPLPIVVEQMKIGDVLDANTSTTKMLSKRQQKLRSLKTALMQDLLTGKKRVTALLNDTEVNV